MAKHKKNEVVPIYLLVVDATPEFRVALQHTAYIAHKNNARLALLHVMEKEDFQHWGRIADKIHEESLAEAENLLFQAADTAREITGHIPVFYLQDGGTMESILEVIKEDKYIEKFILGGSTASSNPGPLVSYFTSKGLSELRVPLTIVPDSVDLSPFYDLSS